MSGPTLRKEPQSTAQGLPKLSSSPLVPKPESLPSQSEATATPSGGTIPVVTSKHLSGRPREPTKNDNVVHQANTKKKVSAPKSTREEKPSKPEPKPVPKPEPKRELKQGQEKAKKSISTFQGGAHTIQILSAPKPLEEEFPKTGTVKKRQQPSAPRIQPPDANDEGTARDQDHSNNNVPFPTFPKDEQLPKATEPKPAPRLSSPWPRPLRRRLSREDTKRLLDEHVFHDKLSDISEERASQLSGASKSSKGKAPETKSMDHYSLAGECGSTPALTNASTIPTSSVESMRVEYSPSDISRWGCGSTPPLTTASTLSTTSANSKKVEYDPSDRSTTTVGSMTAEYSPSDIHRSGCGSTVSNTSIGSMVVELDPTDQPISFDSPWGCGSTPSLTTAGTPSTGSCDSMKVEYSPSDLLSTSSVHSMEVEYTPSAQSELWEDILQRLGVEAEKETGWLVHPEYCGCLGCIKEA